MRDSIQIRPAQPVDAEYDKTNLPAGDLILSNYFTVRDGKIVSLIVIRNTPADY